MSTMASSTTEPIATALKETYSPNAELEEAIRIAVGALQTGIASTAGNATPAAEPRSLGPATLEVAILDANRPRRAFRRIARPALATMLPDSGSETSTALEPAAGSDPGGASDA